ncbi:hypothetical protein AX15_005417 [Amanita polypyramis BW_CC]|nr:hypothetical protein AX15_005417 [Amanita polypyramis BW_CC]
MALLRPSAQGPPSNASAIHDFVASWPLGVHLPILQMVTLHGDWSLTFTKALTLPDLEQLQAALDSFHHPGAEVVNRPTSASLKFPHVPTIHPDGSTVSDVDLLVAIRSHPRWHNDTSFIKVACINCSGPHIATLRSCPFFTHHFNPPALAELQKACLHHLKEAQTSKAMSKPAKSSKGKAKA